MLGHIQIHHKGYVASIENLPLNLSMKREQFEAVEKILKKSSAVEVYSPRIRFAGMLSNFVETTNIRLTGVYPEREFATTPLLSSRLTPVGATINRGEIILPELLASGMKLEAGSIVVVVSSNRDGSVNGMQFTVSGVAGSVVGPGGRDGYIHFEDAAELLRMEDLDVSEIALRVKDFDRLDASVMELKKAISDGESSGFELHTWKQLSPFVNIANMIDVMTVSIRIMLIAIVLISIMNVMIMAVYERIREIGTIAAIGTLPERILGMFLAEGVLLGATGSIVGAILGLLVVVVVNLAEITFDFGMQRGLVLKATVGFGETMIIIGTVLLISVLAALHPAYRASRMEPVEALRHV
jgi:putative ABC transport system permease protein